MRRTTVYAASAAFLLILFTALQGGFAQKGKPPSCGLGNPVTTEFRDAAGDRIRSDGRGAYIGDLNKCEGAFLNDVGGVTLYLKPGDVNDRYVLQDFTDRATSGSHLCNWLFPNNQSPSVEFQLDMSAVDNFGNVIALEAVPVGSTAPGRGKINFTNPVPDALHWIARFRANPGGIAVADLTVTRLSVNEWTIESTVADEMLLQCVTTTKRSVTTDDGYYVMPFSLRVTR